MCNKFLLTFALLTLGLTACTTGKNSLNGPQKALTEYISMSFSVKGIDDRTKLLQFLTGEARTRLEAWSPEQFLEAFIDTKRSFIRLVVVETKPASPTETTITYELTYLDQGKGHNAKVTNKKLCTLILEQDRWVIRDVRNIKELVEYQNEMALP